MSRTAQKKRYFNLPWNLQRTKFGPSTTGVVSRGVCLSTCPPTTWSRSGPWWRMTHDSVTPCYSQPGHTTTGSSHLHVRLSSQSSTIPFLRLSTIHWWLIRPLTTPVILCFTITTTTGTLYAFRLVSDNNKKQNFGHHHKQCCNFVMKPWYQTWETRWRLPWWKENKSSLKVSRWSMITFPPTSLRNHTTSSYELSNKVSRLKLSSASSSMVSFSISWQEKSNTIITRESSTQRRPQVSWTQIHRSEVEVRIKIARLGPAVRRSGGSGSA